MKPTYLENEEFKQDFSLYQVPLYTWSELAFAISNDNPKIQKQNRTICPNLKASKNTYAVSVSDDSMQSAVGNSYPNGSVIYVDPDEKHTSGSTLQKIISKALTTEILLSSLDTETQNAL